MTPYREPPPMPEPLPWMTWKQLDVWSRHDLTVTALALMGIAMLDGGAARIGNNLEYGFCEWLAFAGILERRRTWWGGKRYRPREDFRETLKTLTHDDLVTWQALKDIERDNRHWDRARGGLMG